MPELGNEDLNKRNFRLIIFDCDGVMFDSKAANTAFYNHILDHFGLPPMSPEEIEFVHMATTEESVDRIVKDVKIRPLAQAFRRTVDYTPFTRMLVMEPDLVGLLDCLSGRYKLAVATNRSNTIGPLLEYNRLSRYFDMVVSSLDVDRPKPDPESIFLILERLEVRPEQALFIGDSEADAAAGRAAGVCLVSYRNPHLEADFHVDRLGSIKQILGQCPGSSGAGIRSLA